MLCPPPQLQEDLAGRAGRDKALEARVRSTRANMVYAQRRGLAAGRGVRGGVWLRAGVARVLRDAGHGMVFGYMAVAVDPVLGPS